MTVRRSDYDDISEKENRNSMSTRFIIPVASARREDTAVALDSNRGSRFQLPSDISGSDISGTRVIFMQYERLNERLWGIDHSPSKLPRIVVADYLLCLDDE